MAMFVLLLLLCLVLSQSAAATTCPSDVAALQGLFRAWKRSSSGFVLENWSLDKDADPCGSHWKGVVCCQSHNSIISLDLSSTGLSGSIPPQIGDLHNLKFLDLSGNPLLRGAIPKKIGSLHQLTKLNISNCNFAGDLPCEIQHLENLEFIDISNNPNLSNMDTSPQDSTNSSFNHQQSFALSSRRLLHPRALAQSGSGSGSSSGSKRTTLPLYATWIAIGLVGAVVVGVAICCFFCWYSGKRMRMPYTRYA